MKIGIVGLGLIGGSMAKAIRLQERDTVCGLDINPSVVLRAKLLDAIEEELTPEGLPACDMLILALYPQATIDFMRAHAARLRPDCVVVDCCGVKTVVCEALFPLAAEYGFSFVGGHPMAGRANVGFASAKVNLFAGASMILTPPPGADMELLDRLRRFFLGLGFGSIKMSTPAEHDRMIAYTSQLAHVLSSAYIQSPAALNHEGYSAGSFQDMTRVAWLNEVMWAELFFCNRENLCAEIDALAARLTQYSAALKENDPEKLHTLLRQGRERKELLRK